MRLSLMAAAVAAMLVLSGCDQFNQEAQFKIAAQELSRDMAAMSVVSDPMQAPKIDPNSQAKGKAGAFSRTFKAFLIQVIADRQAYKRELDAANLPDAIRPENVGAPGGLQRAREALAKGEAITRKYSDLTDRRLIDIRQQVRAVGPDLAVVKGFEEGLDSTLATPSGSANSVFDAELKMMAEYSQAYEELERAKGRWRVSGNDFVFDRASDLAAFDAHVRTIQATQVEERLAMSRSRQGMADGVAKMRSEAQ
jgi:hypothetical protein